MAVCKCGEKLSNIYFKDGSGALECLGCGRYENRRVVTFKPILDVLKVIVAGGTDSKKSDSETGDCNTYAPAIKGSKLPELLFPLPIRPVEDIGNRLIWLTNLRKEQRKGG